MEQIFVCNFPDAVTSRITFLRFCRRLHRVAFTHTEEPSVRVRLPFEDNVVLREKCQNLVTLPQSSFFSTQKREGERME